MPIPMLAVMAAMTAASMAAGAMQTRSTNKANTRIAQSNLNAEERAKREASWEAKQQQRESKLGTTDAAGNRTYFVPGVGWKTELSPRQQQLQNASEQEMLRQLVIEAARNERVSGRANERRNREDTLATEAEREMRAVQRPDESALRQLLLARGAATRNEAADRAGEMTARSAVRGGGHNAAALMQGSRAASDQASARQAGIDAQLQAGQMADQQFAGKRDAAAQLYDYFRRASTSGTQSPNGYMPTGPAAQRNGVADQGLINILARAPQQPYKQADYSISDALSGLGQMAGSYYQMQQGAGMNADILKRHGTNSGSQRNLTMGGLY